MIFSKQIFFFNNIHNIGSVSIKETKKIFDTLLSTSSSASCQTTQHFIDIYSLSLEYVLLELGILYKQYDIATTSLNSFEASTQLASTRFQTGFFDLKQNMILKKKDSIDLKELKIRLSELIVKNCLNRGTEFQQNKAKSTFKIGNFYITVKMGEPSPKQGGKSPK